MPTKTFRSSVTRKILEDFDNPLPGIVAASSMQKTDLTDNILEYNLEGWFSKAEKFYNYGKNKTVRGVPDEIDIVSNINIVGLRQTISDVVGSKVVFSYAYLDLIDNEHYVRQYLQDTRNMNPETFEIPGTHIPPNTEGPVTGPCTFTGYTVNVENITVTLTLTYTYVTNNETKTVIEEISYINLNKLVYQVVYFTVSEDLVTSEIPKYWSYTQGTGTYPILDAEFVGSDITHNRYYPIVPFYIDKFQVGDTANSGTAIYEDSKNLVKKLGFNYEDLVSSLEEGTEESIGKNKGLWAYMYLGANVLEGILEPSNLSVPTKSPAEKLEAMSNAQSTLRYLVQFFKKEQVNSRYGKTRFELWKLSPDVSTLKFNTMGITNEEFKTEVSYLYIHKTQHTGILNKVGWCESEFHEEYVHIPLNRGNPEGTDTFPVDVSRIIYRIQDTANSYTELEVCGLQQSYIVKDNYVYLYPSDTFQAEDVSLITVPLDRQLIKEKIPGIYRNELIHSAICFVFNSYIRVEIKWYQTFWATFVFYAIALYFAIPSGGKSLSWAQLFTIEGLKAAAYALLFKLIKYVLYKEFIKIVAKHYGVEVAYILALATMAYGKFGNTSAFPKLPFAENLASIGNSMWSTTNKFIQESMKEVQKDQANVSYQMEQAQRELTKAQQLLKTDAELDPWLFVNPLPNLMFSHNASTFIDIRIHNNNPGIVSLSAPSNYVDLMLTLPTIDDTLTK